MSKKIEEEKKTAETVSFTEAEQLRAMLVASQVREAETMVVLRKTEQTALTNALAAKYAEDGKYVVQSMDIEKGVTRVLA